MTKPCVKLIGFIWHGASCSMRGVSKFLWRLYAITGSPLAKWSNALDNAQRLWVLGRPGECDHCGKPDATYLLGEFICDGCLQQAMRKMHRRNG
jgi:hypothetical protein